MQYTTVYHRPDGRSASSPIQGATSWVSSGNGSTITESSLDDTHLSISRPVPYDAEQRYSRLQRDGLVSRREKSTSHFQEESQPLRRNLSSSSTDPLGFGKKQNEIDSEEDGKVGLSESSEKPLGTKGGYGLVFVQPCSEDEDVCPTCLDGNYVHVSTNLTWIFPCFHNLHLIPHSIVYKIFLPVDHKLCLVDYIMLALNGNIAKSKVI